MLWDVCRATNLVGDHLQQLQGGSKLLDERPIGVCGHRHALMDTQSSMAATCSSGISGLAEALPGASRCVCSTSTLHAGSPAQGMLSSEEP